MHRKYFTVEVRTLYPSLAPHDKERLVSAVPDYFFVSGLVTITEAVSTEEGFSASHGIASSRVYPDKRILELPSK